MANVNVYGRPGSWEVILLSHSQLSCGGNRGWQAETTQTPSLTWFGKNAHGTTEKHTIWHVARINVGYNARPHSLSFFGSDSYPYSICCTLTLTPCKSICVHGTSEKRKSKATNKVAIQWPISMLSGLLRNLSDQLTIRSYCLRLGIDLGPAISPTSIPGASVQPVLIPVRFVTSLYRWTYIWHAWCISSSCYNTPL